MEQNRWRSYTMWAGIIANIFLILEQLNITAILNTSTDTFQKVSILVLNTLVIIGIINNPSIKDKM